MQIHRLIHKLELIQKKIENQNYWRAVVKINVIINELKEENKYHEVTQEFEDK